MNREQLEAARMDGATLLPAAALSLRCRTSARSIAVVIMIEMIFLLSVFAEIFTTTGGGPGDASTNLAFLIFKQALLNFDVGRGVGGGAVRSGARQHRGGVPDPHDRQEPGLRNAWHPETAGYCCLGRVAPSRPGWSTLLIFFPLVWLVLTAFKTELQAIAVPPLLFFTPTLDNFTRGAAAQRLPAVREELGDHERVSTLLGLAIAAPAAYSMAFFRSKRTRDILMWMLSTKMMPAVGALVPVYVLAQTRAACSTRAWR